MMLTRYAYVLNFIRSTRKLQQTERKKNPNSYERWSILELRQFQHCLLFETLQMTTAWLNILQLVQQINNTTMGRMKDIISKTWKFNQF